MEEVFTFDTTCGHFTMTVKSEFLQKADPLKTPIVELMTKHHMGQFIHNPYGPAVVNKKDGYCEYWLNGKQVDEATAEKIKHHNKFNNEMDQILK